ncbi:MAG: hypothetical protein JXM70_22855 [Pirellulales bacterium]|nr:hypothetical protein [Pirellulales bacterium]
MAKVDTDSKTATKLVESERAEYQIQVDGKLDGFNTARYVNLDGNHIMETAGFQPNVELKIENVGRQDVVNPRIVINDRHDWFSIESLVEEIVEPGMTDREKALAVYQVFRDNFYHYNCPELYYEHGVKKGDVYDPIKHLNCYENTGCGPMAIGIATICSHVGLKSRVINFGSSHWISEVFYDDAWHIMDADRKAFYLSRDNRRLVSTPDVVADKTLITRTHHQGFASPDDSKYDTSRAVCYVQYKRNTGTPFEAAEGHTMAITLRPGESIIRRWDNIGKYHDNWRHVKDPPPQFSNGKIIYEPDLSKPYALEGTEENFNVATYAADGKRPYVHAAKGHRGSGLIYRVRSPYCIMGGRIQVRYSCKRGGGTDMKVSVSREGRNWINLWHSRRDGGLECDVSIDDFIGTRKMNAIYEYFVKVDFLAFNKPASVGIDFLRFETDVEMSIPSLPTLRVGSNKVVYRDDTNGPRRVKITHRWKESSANTPPSAPKSQRFPEEGSSTASLSPVLKWLPAVDPDGDPTADYHVEIRDRPDMSLTVAPDLERLTFSGKPEWHVRKGWLIPGKRYYWHVRAKDKRGAWSGWSPTWNFVAGGGETPSKITNNTVPDILLDECLKRGNIYADCASNARKLLQGWLDKNYDSKTKLIYWRRGKNRPRWDYHDVAGDCYSSLVLMAYCVAPEYNQPGAKLHDTLVSTRKLCTLPNGLPGLYYFDTRKVEDEATYLAISEWLRDGLIRIAENLGTDNIWYEEMCRLSDAVIRESKQRGGMYQACSGKTEALGDMLQSLARLYVMSGEKRYLEAAEQMGDKLLLDPETDTFRKMVQRRYSFTDHGCEMLPGLTELFVVECKIKSKRAESYREPLKKILDQILRASAHPDTGLLCGDIDKKGNTVWRQPPHSWGYVFFAYENYDRATGSDRYRKAIEKPIRWLIENRKNFEQCRRDKLWPSITSRNCWDDSHESMVILTNRLGIFDQQVFEWLDWMTLQDNHRKQPDKPYGPYRNAHNDGGAGRCLCTHMMACSRGVRNVPFQEGVRLGGMPSGDGLVLSLQSEKTYKGKLCFDRPRCVYPSGTLDWARINEMPAWFVAEPDERYKVTVKGSWEKVISGKDLIDGISVVVEPGEIQTVLVQPIRGKSR